MFIYVFYINKEYIRQQTKKRYVTEKKRRIEKTVCNDTSRIWIKYTILSIRNERFISTNDSIFNLCFLVFTQLQVLKKLLD